MALPALLKPVSQTLDDERPRPDSPDQATYLHHLARYHFARKWIQSGWSILETGCGTGYGAHLLSGNAGLVLATDYSSMAIEYARRFYRAPNLAFQVMDCREIASLSQKFDCVVSFELFEHLPDQLAFLHDCRHVLRPGGLLLLSTPNHASTSVHMRSIGMTNEFHVGERTLPELRRLLKSSFGEHYTIYGQRRKGNPIYSVLRKLDVWNLRLRLVPSRKRERLQRALGVAPGAQATPQEWVFSRFQLRQCNNFFAVCRRLDE